jgi:hypothetical protein
MTARGPSSFVSQLFTVRVWTEADGSGVAEYRGQVQEVLTGAACAFRDWAALTGFLTARLDEAAAARPAVPSEGGRR